MIGCAVFDLDDTLYLERDYVLSGFRAVGRHARRAYGIDGLDAACAALFEAGVRGDTFSRALQVVGASDRDELVPELVELYRQHEPEIELLADADACLVALAGTLFIGIVTDGPAVSQRAKLEALGLPARIDLAVVTDELGAGLAKPHPYAFELLEQASGVTGRSCLYVGDNPTKDFAGPRSLGWRTVRIRRADGLHRDVASGTDVDSEVRTLIEMINVL